MRTSPPDLRIYHLLRNIPEFRTEHCCPSCCHRILKSLQKIAHCTLILGLSLTCKDTPSTHDSFAFLDCISGHMWWGSHFNKEPFIRLSSLAFLKHECRQCWKHLLLSCALQMLLSILCTLVTCHRVPTLLSGVWLFLCLLESFVFRLHNRNTSKPVATWLPKLLQSFINLLTKDLNSERKGCFELVGYWSRHAEKPLPNPLSSLIYLTRTRPDLSFVVRVVSRFMQDPKESHL